jgi:regulatory protein
VSDSGWHQAPGAQAPAEKLATVTLLSSFRAAEVDHPESTVAEGAEPTAPGERGTTRAERKAGSFDRISNVSMYALAKRGMSSREMTIMLEHREFEGDEIASEVARLEGVGLLDDVELASTLARQLQQRKGLGRSAVVAELRRRQIDQMAIDEALAAIEAEEAALSAASGNGDESDSGFDAETDRAIALAEKRAPQLRSLDQTTAKRRLHAFLMRKGYSSAAISRAVDAALGSGSGNGSGGRGPRFS